MSIWWATVLMLAASATAKSQHCVVRVNVAAGAVIPNGILPDAEQRARNLFHKIGVEIQMQNNQSTDVVGLVCDIPITMRIENTSRYPTSPDALAYSLPYARSGASIHVFIDRILLNRPRNAATALLAHVMSHEITHVLEQIDRHSTEGVMKARWSEQDYQRMRTLTLAFAPEDIALIQYRLVSEQH